MKKTIEVYAPGIITKFKNGDWVKSKAGSIVCITDIDNGIGYGFRDSPLSRKEWRYEGDDVWSFKNNKSKMWSLADMEEVHLALERESKKRGFLYGENFRALDDKKNVFITGDDPSDARVGSNGSLFENGVLYCSGYGKWAMFKDGLWAIPYKRDEIEEAIEFHKEEIELYKKEIAKLESKLNNHN